MQVFSVVFVPSFKTETLPVDIETLGDVIE